MKQYIVTWTFTVNAVDEDQALQMARETLDGGDISPEVEQVEEGMEAAL